MKPYNLALLENTISRVLARAEDLNLVDMSIEEHVESYRFILDYISTSNKPPSLFDSLDWVKMLNGLWQHLDYTEQPKATVTNSHDLIDLLNDYFNCWELEVRCYGDKINDDRDKFKYYLVSIQDLLNDNKDLLLSF